MDKTGVMLYILGSIKVWIISEKVIDGILCYKREWYLSLIPIASAGNKEVIAKYMARKALARVRYLLLD